VDSAQLRIAFTWDGHPIPDSDVATVAVGPEPAGRGLRLEVDAPFHDEPPPPAAPGPCDRLWEFEVVEWFVAARSDGVWRYLEVELSPHGHHLVLRFDGRRNAVDRALPLEYRARIDRRAGRWHGAASVPARYLPTGAELVANAFSIHGPPECRAYRSATPLPGPAPDFHQPERFEPLFAKLER
jgi:hypothetical protein